MCLLSWWKWIVTTLRMKYLPHTVATMGIKYIPCKRAPEGNAHPLHVGAMIRKSGGSVTENQVSPIKDSKLVDVVL